MNIKKRITLSKTKTSFILVSAVFAFLTASCNNLNLGLKATTLEKENLNSKTKIVGVAQFPASDVKFQTKATLAEIAPFATVSVIYPPDHPTNANKTIATGLTDVNGNFTINPDINFNPPTDSIYILEALKRVGTGTRNITPIRTYIKWTGTAWQSMTFPGLFINSKTTALAIIASYNTGTMTSNDTINKIDFSGANPVPLNINAQITAQTVNDVSVLVNTVLTNNSDPMQYINFQTGSYSISNPSPLATPAPASISFGTVQGSAPTKYITITTPSTSVTPGTTSTLTANAFDNGDTIIPDTTSNDKWIWGLTPTSPYRGYLLYNGADNTATFKADGKAGTVTATVRSKNTNKTASLLLTVTDVLPTVKSVIPANALSLPSSTDTITNVTLVAGNNTLNLTFRDENGDFVIPASVTTAYERSFGLSGTGISTGIPVAQADNYDIYVGGFANSPANNYISNFSYVIPGDGKEFSYTFTFLGGGPRTGYILVNSKQGGVTKRKHRWDITIN